MQHTCLYDEEQGSNLYRDSGMSDLLGIPTCLVCIWGEQLWQLHYPVLFTSVFNSDSTEQDSVSWFTRLFLPFGSFSNLSHCWFTSQLALGNIPFLTCVNLPQIVHLYSNCLLRDPCCAVLHLFLTLGHFRGF